MSAIATESHHPPKPRLALAVGIIGHRPNRLPASGRAAVARDIDHFFTAVTKAVRAAHSKYSSVFTAEQPLLSMVSALAEGSDRLGALASLEKGFFLDVPLPFARDVYAQDFPAGPSRDEFYHLLGRARSVLELPGERSAESRAYETGGLTVLGQSDIVLVVWDGGASAGRGGTTEMIQTAIRTGLPIVLVDANGTHAPKIIWQGLAPASLALEAIKELPSKPLADIENVVDSLVRPPAAAAEKQNLARFLHEKRDRTPVRIEYPLLLQAAGVRSFHRTDRAAPDPDALAAVFAASAPSSARIEQVAVVAEAYGWSDALAVRCAQTFRGAFVMNFMFAAIAVVLAALSLLTPPKWFFVTAEVMCICAVLFNTMVGHRRDWHRRWVQPREVAERLRVALPLWALGTRPVSFPGEEPSWIGWYVRALVRQLGLRSGSLMGDEWTKAKGSLTELLQHQCNYHKRVTVPRMHRLHYRLELAGECFFFTTLGVALLYLLFEAYLGLAGSSLSHDTDELVKHSVAAISAGLPAIATALYGIRLIGDFEGIAHRSERTHQALSKVLKDVESDAPDLIVLRARAREAADTMLGDVASWRPAAESRGLSLP
ncbi:MAG: hypothetical protein E6G97_10455 [Alphaproteobacteria bacterium]|nr:MAG: hypothetical protein E6G97_10455 [Alphaproteobacteria bacterium]